MVIFLSPITRIVTHFWLSIGTQKTPHYREPILYLTFISTELYNFYTLYGAVSLIPLYIFVTHFSFCHSFLPFQWNTIIAVNIAATQNKNVIAEFGSRPGAFNGEIGRFDCSSTSPTNQ
jgi:hypothetical protein